MSYGILRPPALNLHQFSLHKMSLKINSNSAIINSPDVFYITFILIAT